MVARSLGRAIEVVVAVALLRAVGRRTLGVIAATDVLHRLVGTHDFQALASVVAISLLDGARPAGVTFADSWRRTRIALLPLAHRIVVQLTRRPIVIATAEAQAFDAFALGTVDAVSIGPAANRTEVTAVLDAANIAVLQFGAADRASAVGFDGAAFGVEWYAVGDEIALSAAEVIAISWAAACLAGEHAFTIRRDGRRLVLAAPAAQVAQIGRAHV